MAQEERKIKEFIGEYEKLVKKTGVDFMAMPHYEPDGNGGWHLKIAMQPVIIPEKTKESGVSFVITDEELKS